jgi:hypothetical protein
MPTDCGKVVVTDTQTSALGQEIHAGLRPPRVVVPQPGNDITILNGKKPKIICSLCGH